MNAIKINQSTATLLETNSWLILDELNSILGIFKSRTLAREAKAGGMKGSIKNKSEVEIEVVTEEVYKPYAYEHHGFINCPHCGIGLDNGVGDHMMEVNGKMKKCTKTKEYWCMACDGEFGPDLKPVAAKPEATAAKRKVEVTHLSTVERPCKKVWAVADEMHAANPNCKRREVLAECVKQGIAFYTARTQYQQWMGIQKEMAERAAMQAAAKK